MLEKIRTTRRSAPRNLDSELRSEIRTTRRSASRNLDSKLHSEIRTTRRSASRNLDSKLRSEINPDEVYTTQEVQDFLKISTSTLKRWLKKGIIRANKVGGRYRILGKELLRLVSPRAERKAVNVYQQLKRGVKKTIEKW